MIRGNEKIYVACGIAAALAVFAWRYFPVDGPGEVVVAGRFPMESISQVVSPPRVKKRSRPMTKTERLAPQKSRKGKANHLIKEKSPYLEQHAYNPVDWYPWGDEAFEKARREGKPIFLSIGYSTCHWCHVMEKESFTNDEIAGIMNKYFVSIKVDREERPDIDKIYMTLATGAGWGGGWPLSIWMTPERKPFYGGTYFPPHSKWGRPGFAEILTKVAGVWADQREKIVADADRLTEALKKNSAITGREADFKPEWADGLYDHYKRNFNPTWGGFGEGGPKFPMPVYHNFLMRYHASSGKDDALTMVETTLGKMSEGGIYDHIGGGFARYSVDGFWRIPHFEKMLYDNAQLAVNALDAYQAGRNPEMARIAGETLDYVLRDMTHPQGGFFSAEDADSLPPELAGKGYENTGHEHKSEGAFYLWTAKELREALGEDAEMFGFRYGVKENGNALEDPHGDFLGKNILYAEHTISETAKKYGTSSRQASRTLKSALAKLLKIRAQRPRPSLDDKVLVSWNGLMISAFAKGYQVLEDERYLKAAEKAAAFIRSELYDEGTHRLKHRWADGQAKVPGMSNDYAFLVQGLIDLYESSFDPDTLDWAIELTDTLQKDFFDAGKGGYYMAAEEHSKRLLVRIIEDTDNVTPSASSVAVLNLLRLDQMAHRSDYRDAAELTLRRFGTQLRDTPYNLPQMMAAGGFASGKPRQIILAGDPEDGAMREMLRIVRSRYRPGGILMVVSPKTRDRLARRLPILKGMVPIKNKPTAYICVNFACELPTNDLNTVRKLLEK